MLTAQKVAHILHAKSFVRTTRVVCYQKNESKKSIEIKTRTVVIAYRNLTGYTIYLTRLRYDFLLQNFFLYSKHV